MAAAINIRDCDVSLEIAQGPQRARMCGVSPNTVHQPTRIQSQQEASNRAKKIVLENITNTPGFGDKDRRPITPPPCVRLIIKDRQTGEPVDLAKLNIAFYVLTVELWDEQMQRETNLVMHPQSGGSGARERRAAESLLENVASSAQVLKKEPASSSLPDAPQQPGRVQLPPFSQIGDLSRQVSPAVPAPIAPTESVRGTTTRNLIGAVVASAFKLQDTEDNLGIWFVLSDLSVRTEGVFRLKFSFFNLTADQENLLDQGSSAVICTGFSEPFTVYSAKKFPGMIESTELSRRFAAQGVKLAVRAETRKA